MSETSTPSELFGRLSITRLKGLEPGLSDSDEVTCVDRKNPKRTLKEALELNEFGKSHQEQALFGRRV